MVELKKLEVREGSLIMRKEDVSQTFFCYFSVTLLVFLSPGFDHPNIFPQNTHFLVSYCRV